MGLLTKVQKRDGTIVPFDRQKIENAITRAADEVLQNARRAGLVGKTVSGIVVQRLAEKRPAKPLHVESIQDAVEMALMDAGQPRLAKSVLGIRDDLKLPLNAMEVLKKRYLLRDDQQNIIETPSQLFRRVATHVAQAEKHFRSSLPPDAVAEEFYRRMSRLEFLPNSPTLMNAGASLGQLCACFVLPVEDSIDGIFEALKHMAKIHQSGGGTGFNFSHLRPKNDLVASTKGQASGPVSFMSIFDKATEVIVQGGKRRGANMGILRCDHPDIVEFIEAKIANRRFSNFNLSVGITDRFMQAVSQNREFDLINPRTRKATGRLKARRVFDLIANSAWLTGDPGLVFLDEINRRNPTPGLGRIEATNPCGELPLLPYESCNLASINLAKMVRNHSLDWEKLRKTIHGGIRFLDDAIEVNRFPLPQIREMTVGNRKIGLGVMGFADLLIHLGIPYGHEESVAFARRLMRFIRRESLAASIQLARERGVFPNFKKSIHCRKNLRVRNATVNTIAPTGSISIIAGCSSGIEPLFAISFIRHVLSGTRLFEVNPLFEAIAKERGFYSKELMAQIAQAGSLKKISQIPPEIRRLFITAFDVSPLQHLRIQEAFQKNTDNSVSKTVNLPQEATLEDVRRIYLAAFQMKCKGITIYRYGSKEEQVLSFGGKEASSPPSLKELIAVEAEFSGGCSADACLF